jgi:hypothetical protein
MTDENDLKLIRHIIAGGGRKYTAENIDRRKYERLVDLDWLTSSATNISDVEYNVTEKGRAAALKNDGDAVHPPPGRAGAQDEEMSVGGTKAQVDFDAPAALRKWPSLRNERRTEDTGPYLLVDGTLAECIREFMAKPTTVHHLYEIHTTPQPPLVSAVLPAELIIELGRLRDFLQS